MKDKSAAINSMVIGEVQLLLAEKRTSLSVLRTGISVLVLPMTVLSVLIATEKYYDVFNVMHLMVPLLLISLALLVLGAYLVIRSIKKMLRYDKLIHQLKIKHSIIGEFID